MGFRLGLIGLAGLLALAGTGEAKPVQTTRYTYYTISGSSPEAVYAAMLRRGPDVNGVNAYATTLATSSQEGKLVMGKDCQLQDYRFKIDFVIKLPRLKNEAALPAGARSDWQKFAAFVKRHEETHRAMWLQCAAELEPKVRALRGKDCAAVDKKADQLWSKMRENCSKRHRAFDAAEQKRLLNTPFVKLVMRKKGLKTTASN
jgi:predicted secreted Zn-dependent protease